MEKRETRFRRAFLRYYALLYPNTPKAQEFLGTPGFGGHTLVYKVEGWGGKLSVKQWVGSETVGTDIRGSKGVEVGALMGPYRKRFEQEFKDDYKLDRCPWGTLLPWYVTYCRPEGGTRNCDWWDEMAKWLEERRKMYETILARGRVH